MATTYISLGAPAAVKPHRTGAAAPAVRCSACTHGERYHDGVTCDRVGCDCQGFTRGLDYAAMAGAVAPTLALDAGELAIQLRILSRKAPPGLGDDAAQTIIALWLERRPANLALSWTVGKHAVADAWRSEWTGANGVSNRHDVTRSTRAAKIAGLVATLDATPPTAVGVRASLRRQIDALQVKQVESIEAMIEAETGRDVAAAVEWTARADGDMDAVSIWAKLPADVREIVHKRLLGATEQPVIRSGKAGRPRAAYALSAAERQRLSRWARSPEAVTLLGRSAVSMA